VLLLVLLLSSTLCAAVGLCWSADGFQLAALDADSTLKLWWMVAEQQQQQQGGGEQGEQPAWVILAGC